MRRVFAFLTNVLHAEEVHFGLFDYLFGAPLDMAAVAHAVRTGANAEGVLLHMDPPALIAHMLGFRGTEKAAKLIRLLGPAVMFAGICFDSRSEWDDAMVLMMRTTRKNMLRPTRGSRQPLGI